MHQYVLPDSLVAQNYLQLWEEKHGRLLQKQSEYIYNITVTVTMPSVYVSCQLGGEFSYYIKQFT